VQKLGQVEVRRSLLRECFRTVDGRLIFPEHFFRLAGTGALPRELPAHDAQKSFKRRVVEVRLQSEVNRRPIRGQRNTRPGGNQANYRWPLGGIFDRDSR
jgi:hypothetical protein